MSTAKAQQKRRKAIAKTHRNTYSTAAKVNRLQKKVNAVLPSKNKFFFASVSGVAPDSTGSVGYTLLCNPAQGDTINNRTGDRLRMNRIKWGISMDHTANSFINNNLCAVRMIILLDHENVFSNAGQILNTTVNSLYSDYLQSERPRWTLIKDKVLSWPASTGLSTTLGASQLFKGQKNLAQKLATFGAGATTVYHGQLKVFFISNAAPAAGTTAINFYSEVFFSDVL